VKYAEQERDHLKLLNPDEAEKVYSTFLALSDMLGLDKFAKDGGMSYTQRELDIVRRVMTRKDMPGAELVHTLNSAYFRAIDTNGDHFLERSEWTNYLKIIEMYTPVRSKPCSRLTVSIRTKTGSFRWRSLPKKLWISGAILGKNVELKICMAPKTSEWIGRDITFIPYSTLPYS
jgi:hypothetical protein